MKHLPRPNWKRLGIAAGCVLGLFVLINVGVYGYFRGRLYPNTRLSGHALGSIKQADLAARIGELPILPDSITFTYQDKSSSVDPRSLGLAVDIHKTAELAQKQKSWLPLANFFTKHELSVQLAVQQSALQEQLAELAKHYQQPPMDARIVIQNGSFSLQSEADGYALRGEALADEVAAALTRGQTTITLPVTITPPKVTRAVLEPALAALSAQQNIALTYRHQGKSKKFTPAEITTWYVADGASLKLSETKVRAALAQAGSGFGIFSIQNLDQAVAATTAALQNRKALDFTFTPQVARTFTYCVQLRNVDASFLPELQAKLAAVYADARGWSMNGNIAFTRVSSGCNFTVWLSAADQMPTFGSICDSTWSCRSGPNVVINFDRWRLASPAWNQSAGSLDDYRSMVINHETGHWLNFYHLDCGGPGQLAPVMQQQSINLQGCRFNPWPTAGELQSLRSNLRL